MKKYRVIENVYRHQIVQFYDEENSTTHSINIVYEKEFEEEITVDYFSPKRINLDGYFRGTVDINYELQIFDEEKKEWCFVGFLKEKYDD